MGRVLDFRTKHVDKILSFDPGISSSGGLGYACTNIDAEIFGGTKNKPFISHCGLLVPFASDPRVVSLEELCDKAVDNWKKIEGYTREPKVLIIENPVIYPNSPVRKQDIIDLSKIVGMLSRSFQPQRKFYPIPAEWKGNTPKLETQNHILSILDSRSKKVLERDLDSVPISKRHNVFDALGLAFYAASVLLKNTQAPLNDYQPKEYREKLIQNTNGDTYARY